MEIEKQNKNSKEIAEIAGNMHDQIAKTINLLDKTELQLSKSLENIEEIKKIYKRWKGKFIYIKQIK